MPRSPSRLPVIKPTAALLIALLAASTTPRASAELHAQTGSITGTVRLEPPPPPRRSADRYARGSSAPKQIQTIPAVVYIEGRVGSAGGASGTVRMEQRDTAFAPAAIFVQAGGTVDFPNADPFFHNVFSYSQARRFDLGRYPQNESKSVIFDEPGIVSVFCEVHDHMRGVIVVTESAFSTVVSDDGTFTIDAVPPGEYTLRFWHPDHREVDQTVSVASGQATTVDVELRR